MAGFATSAPDRHRTGILALTSLRRNLFPSAHAYGRPA